MNGKRNGKSTSAGKKEEESDVDMDSISDVSEKDTKTKIKKRDSSEELPPAPDANLLATWKRGGSNVESSAKMMRMVEYLKEWESTGDKTIVFSQCKLPLLCSLLDCVETRRDATKGS